VSFQQSAENRCGAGPRFAGHGTRVSPQAGLTLIEVVVAVSLLGLLSAGIVTALQMSAGSWRDVRERLTQDRRIANSNHLLHAMFAGMVPVLAQPPPSAGAPQTPFFHGDPQQMRFISSYSLEAGARGALQVIELNVQQGANGLRLILTQSPFLGGPSVGRFIVGLDRTAAEPLLLFRPVQPRADSLIVADQLASCSFEYLREPRTPSDPALWRVRWDDLRQIPAAVRVVLEPAQAEARLQPVTVVAEVRARYAPPAGNGQQAWIDPNAVIIEGPNGRRTLSGGAR
jgi:prepilin-type N-terminal cleavage/methylation domain-containing protein